MPRLRAGRPEAAALIWSWRRADPAEGPAHSSARLRGALQTFEQQAVPQMPGRDCADAILPAFEPSQ